MTGIRATVQIPGITSKMFKDFTNKTLSDPALKLATESVLDEKLFRQALKGAVDVKGKIKPQAVRKLNSWMLAAMMNYEHNHPNAKTNP
jgi:hypothetical protein